MSGRRAGLLDTAAFPGRALLMVGRAIFFVRLVLVAFFRGASPAAFAVDRARALALAAAATARPFLAVLRAAAVRDRLVAALREADFRVFAFVTAAAAVSSAVNRSLITLISFFRRESAVVTSRIASLPSAMRKWSARAA